VYIAKEFTDYLPFMGGLALLPAIAWIYIYFNNSRSTGIEVFGENIWWNNLRPIHAFLYILFSIMAFNKNTQSWKILFVDVLIGLLAFLIYHHNSGNFSILFNK
jgi:hypothetical protein